MPAQFARYGSLPLVEERVNGAFDGRGQGSGHVRRRQLRQIANVRFSDSQASRQ